MPLIVGQDNFGSAIQKRQHFIDKSLWIKSVFDHNETEVDIIVRPRRFGKTFNMSMLHHFLAAEAYGFKTEGIFDGLKIAQCGDQYMQHQGKYPVIFITFKDVKSKTYEEAYPALRALMARTYDQHAYLLTSSKLSDPQKEIFASILEERAAGAHMETALLDLTKALYTHHGVKPWLLMDEYDTPIQAGYLNNHYDQIIGFMRRLFGSVLKSNPYLHRAVITGILRIAKENLFSDLNNVKVYSVLDAEYADHFGFTETEVDTVLQDNNLQHLSTEIKSWYNGYRIGNTHVYNPWSIANCVNEEGLLKAYWVNTSGNELIKKTMARATPTVKTQLEMLLEGRPISEEIAENITFTDLDKNGDKIWSLLLFAGYLTVTEKEWVGTKVKCSLIYPNQEVLALYRDIVMEWLNESFSGEYPALLNSLISGNTEEFLEILQKFLFRSASYFDVSGEEPERFYHGLVMGLMISLSATHQVQSNKESGYGRYDVMLIPKDPQKLGIIIEFKVAKSAELLQTAASDALKQITDKNYAAELQHKGIERILKMGLAFYRKEVAMLVE